MLLTLISAFKVPDLRKRIFFVFGAFSVFIFGLHVYVPGIDREAMAHLFEQGGLLGLLDVFTGGALRKFSILAMGITPYINASIIMQLLTVVIPQIEQLQKEGESGRKVISRYTRYLTIALALVQAVGMTIWLKNAGVITQLDVVHFLRIIITLTAGTAFLMWLGEQITDKGIGNGVSLIIFVGIVARMPTQVAQTISLYQSGGIGISNVLSLMIIAVAIVAGIVYVQQAERRVSVQYTKRIVGRKVYGGQSTYLPLKVNQAGVIPIIFAISILLFPATIAQFVPVPAIRQLASSFNETSWYYNLSYALLVIFFTYFYTAVTFNPVEVADNMKKYGGFVPGIRPGKPTSEYLDRILTRITLLGALFLAFIAVIPSYIISLTHIGTFYLGGTSLLIVVGVALDTVQQIEAQMLMRHYEGFIK
ncbi:MAG: preprotein translocase subunit SecY [Armatimonadetes bacterium CG07_land_8_20_14_0_80_40_9]|nr:MAG: preprotein translocase subunit SecY [Armatimonadetes bacterium CG07_land_8_20_14_0_80_40_9]